MELRTINLAIPQGLLKQIDVAARTEFRSRSELIREAARLYLAREARWERIFDFGKRQAAHLGLSRADVPGIVAAYRKRRK